MKHFQNLYGLKIDSSFDVNDIKKIEINISSRYGRGHGYVANKYVFKVKHNDLICHSVIDTDMTQTHNIATRRVKIKSKLDSIKTTLKHIIEGDKIIPLSDIKSSDTSRQVVDLYDQFDGDPCGYVICSDCSYNSYIFTFYTSKSKINISEHGTSTYVESVLLTSNTTKVFSTKPVAEWMYAYALSHELLPTGKIIDVFFSDKDFNQFKKRMSLR